MLSTANTLSAVNSPYRIAPIDAILQSPSIHQRRGVSVSIMASSAVDRVPSPLPPIDHDISRSSSTSTLIQYQPNFNHALPGLSTLASVASDSSAHFRAFNHNSNAGHAMNYTTSSPGATTGGPVCQNCTTSTTPLWRRDEIGSVLCNACGLFLKLHGTARPISLKTDVIKSRNRVKTAAQGQRKRSLFEANGNPTSRSEAGTPPPSLVHNRLASRKSSSGPSGRSKTNSPVSRTDTPILHHPTNIAPQHLFDGVSLAEHNFHPSPSMPSLQLRQPSPSSNSSQSGSHLEPPLTYEGLKTRVSELEVINNLYLERVSQLEQNDVNARRSEALQQNSETRLRSLLKQSQDRENSLKRQIELLEREVADLKDMESHTKRQRLSDESQYPDPPEGFTP